MMDFPLVKSKKNKTKKQVEANIYGSGSGKKYGAGASLRVPISDRLSVGAEKFMGKDEYGKFKNTEYNVSLRIPIKKKSKS